MIIFKSYDAIFYLLLMLVFIFFKDITYIKENIFNSNHIFDLETLLNYLIFDILLLAMCFYNIKVSNIEIDIFKKILHIPKTRNSLEINIFEIKSIERIDGFYDKYTNKLNKLEVVFEGYNYVKFSTIENEKLIQTLLQLNPNIRIKK